MSVSRTVSSSEISLRFGWQRWQRWQKHQPDLSYHIYHVKSNTCWKLSEHIHECLISRQSAKTTKVLFLASCIILLLLIVGNGGMIVTIFTVTPCPHSLRLAPVSCFFGHHLQYPIAIHPTSRFSPCPPRDTSNSSQGAGWASPCYAAHARST